MEFPLLLKFKVVAVAPQITVTDASGRTVCYVKQKLLKFKEHVNVFTGPDQETKLCEIKADRIIDWSASYTFHVPTGESFGSIKRKGARSLWKAEYEIHAPSGSVYTLKEESAMVRFMDGIVGDIPVLGMFSGYLFHPTYNIFDSEGTEMVKIKKRPAMWEGIFEITECADVPEAEEITVLLSVVMMLLLERFRG